MLNTIEELKSFILWAKEQKMKAVKVGDISFEFSDMGIAEMIVSPVPEVKQPVGFDSKTMAELDEPSDEKDLYWSST